MKKNRTMRIAVLMLALSLLTCCFVGSTFAKYTSSTSGNDTARVALWDIVVENKDIAVTGAAPTLDFNLFDYVDTGVKDVTDNLVAPGTTGMATFDIVNNSEVKAQYTVTFTEVNDGGIFLQYSLDGTTWVDSIDELDTTTDNKYVASAVLNYTSDDDTDKTTINLYWRWAFDNTDAATVKGHEGQTNAADTNLGVAGAAEVTINASILVEQVDN